MNILTFDTAFDKTYITLSKDEKLLSSYAIASDSEKYHSAYLISNLAKILKENNMKMSDINYIATNIGPGSFTGIRVCMTVAKIISQQLNINAFGVPSLEIFSKSNKTENQQTLVITDARKDKFYVALYNKEQVIHFPECVTMEKMLELAQKEYYIIADTKVSELLKQNQINSFNFEDKDLPFGEYLLEIVKNRIESGIAGVKWYDLKPLYIQPPPITMKK